MSLAQQDNGGTSLDGKTWVHFSSYRIWGPTIFRDASIVPSSTATGTIYDPIDDHRRRRNTGVPTALDRLISLASAPVPDPRMVLEWTRDFGLLGLLPHEAVEIRLPPWELAIKQNRSFVQDVFVRNGPTWRSHTLEDFEADPQELVRSAPIVRDISDSMDWNGTTLAWDEFCNRYFWWLADDKNMATALPICALLGLPTKNLTEDWSKYGEPFDEWVMVAQHFARAVKAGDCLILDELASRSRLTLEKDGQEFRQRMRFSSLLSVLAAIAIQELTGGLRPVVCAAFGCGKTVLTSAYQRKYCSDACQWRQRKRTQRANARDREEV